MLFYVAWRTRAVAGADEKSLEVFTRWQPPNGLEFKGMWGRADGAGFAICEATSAEAVYEACAPWAGALLDYEIMPIVPIEKAVELAQKGVAFRNG
jgi:hypothetical protein